MKKLYSLFLAIFFISLTAQAQNREPREMYLDPPTNDFVQIQQMMEQYFEGKDKGRGSGYKQWKRWEFLQKNRLDENGKITNWSERNFDEYHRYLAEHETAEMRMITNGSWIQLGPTSWSNLGSGHNGGIGRVNCIAFHPTLASTVYLGTPAGGLWRTTNMGTSWTGLTDGLPSIGVSGIAVTNAGNTIYILTGDGDGGDTDCIGVLKSTNAGETWLSTGLSFSIPSSVRGYKLVMHPSNDNILMAATTSGIYRTTNGGASWTIVQSGSFRDIEFKPGTPTTVYAVTTSSFYKSTDTGVTWTVKSAGAPSGETRSAIAVTPANPAYVYTLAGPATAVGVFKGVYRSFDSGESTELRSSTPNILGYSSAGNDNDHQTTYDLAMCVSNTSTGTIVTGGINLWRSTDFGVTMNNVTQWTTVGATEYVHADIHALETSPHDNSMWCGSDGGIFRSTDDGQTWTDLTNSMSLMQFYDIAITEATTGLIYGGTQDNGTNKWTGGSSIQHMEGGDGFDCVIDPSNSNIVYGTVNSSVWKTTNGGSSITFITPPSGTGWSTNLAITPSTPTTVYAGDADVNKSTNSGSTWTNTGSNAAVALEVGTNNSNRVYAASGTTIDMSNDAAGSWTSIIGTLPLSVSVPLTDIAINPDNSPEVWVSLGGYSAGNKVFRSGNAGTTWVNYSGSLPNVPINTIVFEDNDGTPDDAVYVGTDVGVFYRDATLGDWIPFSNWLPNVRVFDLQVHQGADLITAGTHGRGLWRSATYTACPPSWLLSGTAAAGYSYYQASDWISSSREINGGIGAELHFKAGNTVTLTDGFWAHANSEFNAVLGACGAGIPIAAGVPITGTYAGPMPGIIEETVENSLIFNDENSYLIYPNPFNNYTTIEYFLNEESNFAMYVTDIYGKLIQKLVDKSQHPEGTYKVNFDGSNLASGMYFCHLVNGNEIEVVKLILEK